MFAITNYLIIMLGHPMDMAEEGEVEEDAVVAVVDHPLSIFVMEIVVEVVEVLGVGVTNVVLMDVLL